MKKWLVFALGMSALSLATHAQETSQQTSEVNVGQPVLKLEATIRGSREQPKVMSIVPWQPPSQNNLLPSPVMQRINQTFSPLDREEFLRRLDHFEKLSNK